MKCAKDIDKRILLYIEQNHVLTLATTNVNGKPYAAMCFYAYVKEENKFIFSSAEDTRHAQEFLAQPLVAGTIYKPTRTVGKVKGLQFTGKVYQADTAEERENIRQHYIKAFPYAVAMSLKLWCMLPDFFKLTDNTLGFGKKITWQNDRQ